MSITFSELGGLNDPIFGKHIDPITMMMEKRAEEQEQKSLLPYLFAMENSDKYSETLGDMTNMDEWMPVVEGGAVPVTGMHVGFTKNITHVTFMQSFGVTRQAIKDGKILNLKGRPAQFVAGYYRGRETIGSGLFGAALKQDSFFEYNGHKFSATCADGLPLFHKEHPSADKKVKTKQCNCFSDPFSIEALDAVETEMQNFCGHNNDLLTIQPTTIVIPNSATMKRKVFAAIGADQDPNGSGNGFNYQYGRWRVIVNNKLNWLLKLGLEPWFLMDEDYNKDAYGAVWFDREELDITTNIEPNRVLKWNGYARYGLGFNDWRAFAAGGMPQGIKLVG